MIVYDSIYEVFTYIELDVCIVYVCVWQVSARL